MRIADTFKAATLSRIANLSSAHAPKEPWEASLVSPRRRSGIKLAGAFLFMTLVVALGAALRPESTRAVNSPNKSHASSVELQMSQSSNTSPSTVSNGATTNTDVSTNQSTASGGQANTQVTVNGQSIPVPDNGSSQQTITSPDGSTNVQVSNNQTSSGSSGNSNYSHTHVQVYSSSNSQEDN